MAKSDHDLVWIGWQQAQPRQPRSKPTWGARRFVKGANLNQEVGAPPPQMDTHTALHQLAMKLTEAGSPSMRFRESREIKRLREQARRAPPDQIRAMWKVVARRRKQEFRAWNGSLVKAASCANWGAYRAINQLQHRVGWEHALLDERGWQHKMQLHFKGIFARAPASRTQRRLEDTRGALTRLCKRTQWRPFRIEELQLATRTWKNNKAAGPDAITHEILNAVMKEPSLRGLGGGHHVRQLPQSPYVHRQQQGVLPGKAQEARGGRRAHRAHGGGNGFRPIPMGGHHQWPSCQVATSHYGHPGRPRPGSNRDEARVQLHARAEEGGGRMGVGQASAKASAPILLRLGGHEGDGSNLPHPPPHSHSPTHAMGTDDSSRPHATQGSRHPTHSSLRSLTSPQTRSRSPLLLPARTTPEQQHRNEKDPPQQKERANRNMRMSSSCCSTHR